MREETSTSQPKGKLRRSEIVTGQTRVCKLTPTFLDSLNGLALDDQSRARSAVREFANLEEIDSYPMHVGVSFVSLRNEQWTIIFGVRLYFFPNSDGTFVLFCLSIDSPNNDDGGSTPLYTLPDFMFTSLSTSYATPSRPNDTQTEAFSRDIRNSCAQIANLLVYVLFGRSNSIAEVINIIATTITISGREGQRLRAVILSTDINFWDFRDISIGSAFDLLEAPYVWNDPDDFDNYVAERIADNPANNEIASGQAQIAGERVFVELDLIRTPGGSWLLSLEVAHNFDDRHVAAYAQLGACDASVRDSATDDVSRRPLPVGRLQVLLCREK